MRIVHINSVYRSGSTGRIVKAIHEKLKNKNHLSYVFYGRGEIIDDSSIQRISNPIDWNYHGLATRLFDKHGLASKRVTRNLVSELISINADVIHLHNLHGYYLNYPILFNFLKTEFTGKIIWTMHDCWAFTGHCAHYSYVSCNKWKTHCDQCPQIKRYPKSYYLDNSFNNFEIKRESFLNLNDLTIVTPSHWLANELKSSFLKDYENIVINNGVDKKRFHPIISDNFKKEYNLMDKFVILGVANIWEDRKGITFFEELSHILPDNFVIILVGKYQGKIQSNKIIYINQTESIDELVDIYSNADIFVNPTLEDNYPTTNLESLACNTPIITFDSGGCSETINDKDPLSIVIQDKTAQSLLKAIKTMVIKLEKNKNFDTAKYIKKTESMVNDYITLYQK